MRVDREKYYVYCTSRARTKNTHYIYSISIAWTKTPSIFIVFRACGPRIPLYVLYFERMDQGWHYIYCISSACTRKGIIMIAFRARGPRTPLYLLHLERVGQGHPYIYYISSVWIKTTMICDCLSSAWCKKSIIFITFRACGPRQTLYSLHLGRVDQKKHNIYSISSARTRNIIIVSASRIPPGPVIRFLNTVGSSFLICGAGCMLKLLACM